MLPLLSQRHDDFEKRRGRTHEGHRSQKVILSVRRSPLVLIAIVQRELNLLKNNRDILEQYQERFKYILVDEYQDTNKSQFALLKLLNGDENKIFVVGDEDQSIY